MGYARRLNAGGTPMGKRIILLSDGTGNSSAKVWRTNVWRVFESLDLSGNDQVAFYDDGVGTSSFKPMAVLGGAFGHGLKRNALDLYKFACRNYRGKDDAIYGFGFSRGAFTIRVVIGLILEEGLVEAASEEELDAKARAAYRSFRKRNFHTNWYHAYHWLLGLFGKKNVPVERESADVNVRFLGLWDTVAAYGMPVEEMTRGIGQWIWPWQIPDCKLNKKVTRACHALSIDDERTTFHPILWDERKEDALLPREDGNRYLTDERISQVWFAGVHSNVGGGYPDDSIAQIPLVWIMSEAKTCGLSFKSGPDANPQTYGHPITAQDKDGRIYDPRKGLGGYYRYGPRSIHELGKELLCRKGTGAALPRIHESVLKRIRNNAQSYAPNGLPAKYEVVTRDGRVLAPFEPVPELGAQPYETEAQARARFHLQERVWNIVWVRRIAYFVTVGVSIYLAIFPLLKALPPSAELSSSLRWVSDVVRLVGSYLPGAAAPWIEGYARDPGRFILVSAVLALLLWWSGWLAGKIQNRMGIHWQQSLRSGLFDVGEPQDPIYRLRTNDLYKAIHFGFKRYVAPALFALVFVYLGLTLTSHVLFNIQDDAGLVCREKAVEFEKSPQHPKRERVKDYKGLVNLGPGDTMLASGQATNERVRDTARLPEFKTAEVCQSMGVWLERNGRYLIRFESTDSFKDGVVPASEGYYSTDPASWWQRALTIAAVPLRRELIRPWFRAVVRIGGKGGEEIFLDPDFSDKYLINEPIIATRDGELFLFVNDAVIGIPGLNGYFYKLFYADNEGSTRVTISRR
jgi:uncharacterized protein (DUF2235 family)